MCWKVAIVFGIGVLAATPAEAAEFSAVAPIYHRGSATYYVAGTIEGYGDTEFLVDTGSAYVVINEKTVASLRQQGTAEYVKKLSGTLADGTRLTVPVYRVKALRIGSTCVLRDIEAAVFPGTTRHILGLNALRRAGSFEVSFDPPQLRLGDCARKPARNPQTAQSARAGSGTRREPVASAAH